MKNRFLPLLATLGVIAVNAAATLLPINGYATGELSDLYPTGFTPPGYVFSIWSLIYLGLIAYGITALRQPPRSRARLESLQGPYLLSALGNAGWIFAWHYRQIELSVAVMLFLLGTLIVIFRRLWRQPAPSNGEFLVIDGPFSLYFGWISTATLVNIAALFHDWQWYPFQLVMNEWAIVSVCFATGIYVWMVAVTRNLVYGAVFLWAVTGIFLNAPIVTDPVRVAAITGVAAVGVCMIWALFNPRRRASLRGP